MLQFEDVKVFIRDIVRRRTIKKLITQKDDPLEIELTGGGEPTYNWELFCESIRFIKGLCKENRIPVQLRLTTNGMISENQADFVAANIDHMQFGMLSRMQRKRSEILQRKRLLRHSVRSTLWEMTSSRKSAKMSMARSVHFLTHHF